MDLGSLRLSEVLCHRPNIKLVFPMDFAGALIKKKKKKKSIIIQFVNVAKKI